MSGTTIAIWILGSAYLVLCLVGGVFYGFFAVRRSRLLRTRQFVQTLPASADAWRADRFDDSMRLLRQAVGTLERHPKELQGAGIDTDYPHVGKALDYLIDRRRKFAQARNDYDLRIGSIINLAARACRGGAYENIELFRLLSARWLCHLIDTIKSEEPPADSDDWTVAGETVGHLGWLAVSEELRSVPDESILKLTRAAFEQLPPSNAQQLAAQPPLFTFTVLATLNLLRDVNILHVPLVSDADVAKYVKDLATDRKKLGAKSPAEAIRNIQVIAHTP